MPHFHFFFKFHITQFVHAMYMYFGLNDVELHSTSTATSQMFI